MLTQSPKKARLPSNERDALVLKLRALGTPIQTIADRVGCSSRTVDRVVARRLDELSHQIRFNSAQIRAGQLLELEMLRGRLAPLLAADDPSDRVAAVRTWLQLLERESRLLGLDQPMKIELAAEAAAAEALLQHLADRLPPSTMQEIVDALANGPTSSPAGRSELAAASSYSEPVRG